MSQDKGLWSIRSSCNERQFHYTDTGLKEMPGIIGNNQKRIPLIAFKEKTSASFKMSILTFQQDFCSMHFQEQDLVLLHTLS